jgi:hypothetical protein
MRTLMAAMLLISLSACASTGAGPATVGGVASYDALKNAREACVAKGGELVRNEHGSGQRMSDYACKRK